MAALRHNLIPNPTTKQNTPNRRRNGVFLGVLVYDRLLYRQHDTSSHSYSSSGSKALAKARNSTWIRLNIRCISLAHLKVLSVLASFVNSPNRFGVLGTSTSTQKLIAYKVAWIFQSVSLSVAPQSLYSFRTSLSSFQSEMIFWALLSWLKTTWLAVTLSWITLYVRSLVDREYWGGLFAFHISKTIWRLLDFLGVWE